MNTTVTQPKTVEQLKAELQVAEEALREQERQVRERGRQEKFAAERAKADDEQKVLNEKMATLLQPICIALQAAGVTCSMHGASIATGNQDTTIHGEREERRSGTGYFARSSYTGRFIVSVGCTYRDFPRVRYPQKKDGTFNVDKIVATVKERLETINYRAAEKLANEKKKISGATLADQLNAELGTTVCHGTHGRYLPTGTRRTEYLESVAPDGHVYMSIGSPLYNPAQVRVMVKALKEAHKLATKKGV